VTIGEHHYWLARSLGFSSGTTFWGTVPYKFSGRRFLCEQAGAMAFMPTGRRARRIIWKPDHPLLNCEAIALFNPGQ
jgi:hypothetical protein